MLVLRPADRLDEHGPAGGYFALAETLVRTAGRRGGGNAEPLPSCVNENALCLIACDKERKEALPSKAAEANVHTAGFGTKIRYHPGIL